MKRLAYGFGAAVGSLSVVSLAFAGLELSLVTIASLSVLSALMFFLW